MTLTGDRTQSAHIKISMAAVEHGGTEQKGEVEQRLVVRLLARLPKHEDENVAGHELVALPDPDSWRRGKRYYPEGMEQRLVTQASDVRHAQNLQATGLW